MTQVPACMGVTRLLRFAVPKKRERAFYSELPHSQWEDGVLPSSLAFVSYQRKVAIRPNSRGRVVLIGAYPDVTLGLPVNEIRGVPVKSVMRC